MNYLNFNELDEEVQEVIKEFPFKFYNKWEMNNGVPCRTIEYFDISLSIIRIDEKVINGQERLLTFIFKFLGKTWRITCQIIDKSTWGFKDPNPKYSFSDEELNSIAEVEFKEIMIPFMEWVPVE